ncbi:peptide/nickel transport system ATP-binding protein [Actinopolymorpha cephalotaxi]|uniref:Peptide/nickel transport system ATP-binding protein n=1 Tax=Actinopolymorpha cephalotaxi TaxID=504797 RepID=A0A1I2TQT8_9ACTN|nr:ABC transporter ATP-binding protein [Actinopolymorpha cephalotaxi]NYH83186.1 peptide/nickel transport system ATP-binding protein [Actinopolymorpha cephalotaxi]SFG67258.1 peptide/nickel transport system ATP-binding protein [Actinopolymorpha cephalotaxi]
MNQSSRSEVAEGGRRRGRARGRGQAAATAPASGTAADPSTLLRITDLHTHFTSREGVVRAVDGVDLTVPKGRTVCVVGESGCGKSVTARSILQLVDRPGAIAGGRIDWRPSTDAAWTDLAKLDPRGEEIRRVRGAEIGMVFQEPMASLSPMYTVGDQLVEAILLHLPLSKEEAHERAVAQLRRVGIPQPERRMDAYPFQLSGGMCQRVMIAIALSCDPALLIADEPTTALDVTTQARILDLLKDLQDQTGMAMVFITHDLGVVAEIADEVTVMYLGKVAEHGTVREIFDEPKHPYTQALLRSIPTMRGSDRLERQRLAAIRGMVPHPQNRPAGCPFHTRCDHVIAGVCDKQDPPLVRFGSEHLAQCHLYDQQGELTAAGAGAPAGRTANGDRAPAEPVALETPKVPTGGSGVAGGAAGGPVRVRERPDGNGSRPRTGSDAPLVEVRDLSMHFPIKRGMFGRTTGAVRAVDSVDFTITPGETLGLVGESGCGKTTLGRCLARVLQPSSGEIRYRRADGETVDLARMRNRELAPYRREIRVIFQDPFSSLNPRMTLLQLVGEPLRTNNLAQGSELQDRVADMLRRCGLRPEYMRRYPHAFSGGERQRINIARALITEPRLVIADEAVSALDVSVRAQILNLLGDLQAQFDLTYLFISHDLSVVEHLCDRVTVMYLGSIVETADTSSLYTQPHHPYTEALLNAVPLPDPHNRRARHEHGLPDDLPDAANPPSGCLFHTRCPHVQLDRCGSEVPALREVGAHHLAACHFAEELTLSGASRK